MTGPVDGLFVALFGAAAPAAFILGVISAMNLLAVWSGLGSGVLNHLGLQPLLVLCIGLVAVGTVFVLVHEKLTNGGEHNR